MLVWPVVVRINAIILKYRGRCYGWSEYQLDVQTLSLPDTNELLVEDHPGQKVDKGGVGGEDGGDHRAVKVLQGGDVEIIGEDWHQTEEKTPW